LGLQTPIWQASSRSVSTVTIWRWAGRYEEFCNALKTGKSVADERVERSLYHKAVGYTFDAVKIFIPSGAKAPVHASYREHVPPDTTACISGSRTGGGSSGAMSISMSMSMRASSMA